MQELTRLLTSTKNQQEMKDLLAGLANAGSIDALPAIRPFLENPEASVREAAVLGLRLLDDPQVEPLLIARLSADAAATVRATAIEDAGRRDAASETLTRAVSKAASNDADVQVRVTAVRTLGKWLRTRPALRTVIEGIAAKDADPSVLIVAKAALAAEHG